MANHEGKVAVVTGAGRGIGRATCLALAKEGAKIVGCARTTDDLRSLEEELNQISAVSMMVPVDIRNDEEIAALHKAVVDEFGRIDILVNNAGIGQYTSVDDTSMEDFDNIFDTNMRGTYAVTKAFLPVMKAQGSGHIVMVSSVAGLHGFPDESAYCAAKFGQVGFAEALDNEVREFGIKVSTVCPGGVKTHFALGSGRTEGEPKLDSFMSAEDVAEAIRFCLSVSPQTRILQVVMRPITESVAGPQDPDRSGTY